MPGLTLDSLRYLYKGEDVIRDTTMLVVTDLNTAQGRQLLSEAISHMVSKNCRNTFLSFYLSNSLKTNK